MFEHRLICPKYEEEDDFAWMYRGVKATPSILPKKKRDAALLAAKTAKAAEPLLVGPNEAANRVMQVMKDRNGKPFCVPKPPQMPENVHKKCRLDVRLETVSLINQLHTTFY